MGEVKGIINWLIPQKTTLWYKNLRHLLYSELSSVFDTTVCKCEIPLHYQMTLQYCDALSQKFCQNGVLALIFYRTLKTFG